MLDQDLGVLFINSSRTYGGTESWTLRAARQLDGRGHRVVVGYRHAVVRQHAERLGLRTVRLPLAGDGDLYSVFLIARTMVADDLQVVLPTRNREYWLGALAAKLVRRKCVLRLGIVRRLEDKWKNRTLYGRLVDAIQVNSQAIVEALKSSRFISKEKVRHFYNGVETPASLPPIGGGPVPFVFIHVGALIPRKNVAQLLKVFARLADTPSGTDVRLWLIGDGEERMNLEKLADELTVRQRITFWGQRDDVSELLRRGHALVLLSRSEGFPTAVLEGMALGVPAIVGRIPGIEEIVRNEENGLVVDLGDEQEILESLRRIVIDQDLRARLRASAFELVKRRFSLEAMGENLEKLLIEVVRS